MFQAHRIGRLFGVDVRLHGTVLLMAAVLAFVSLLSGGLAGAVGTLLLLAAVFGSVTLHELGHIGASALFGGRTLGVTLYPFGGVAQLSRESRSGFEEIVVALAGPAVNFVLAGLAAIPLVVFGPTLEPFATLLGVNLALGIFNLIPAFPMDGGRVLRGALWGRLGRARATELAARGGRWFAGLFAILGLLWSPMLLVIAAFVFLQATEELARLRLQASSEPLRAQGPFGWTHPVPGQPREHFIHPVPRPEAQPQGWVLEQVRTPYGVVVRWAPRGY